MILIFNNTTHQLGLKHAQMIFLNHILALLFANVEANFENTTPRMGIQGYCCIQISQNLVWISYLLFVLHSKLRVITPMATKVHVISRSFEVLTWMYDTIVLV